MKKKFIIPSLLFACSLTACNDGLVTGGVAYTEGTTANVDESIKKEQKGSFKEIVVESEGTTAISIKFNGETTSAKADATSSIKVDLDDKTVDVSIESVTKSGKNKTTQKAAVKVKKVNSSFQTISSSGDFDTLLSSLDYSSYFTFADTYAFSWNFSISDDEIKQAVTSVSGSNSSSIENALKEMRENMRIDGDPDKGSFDVGISKPLPFTIDGVNMKYTKMRQTYKDYKLVSRTMGIEASKSNGSTKVTYALSATYNYEYK